MGSDFNDLPMHDGMYLRDALQGAFTDIDEGKRQVQVTFPHDTVDTYKTTFDRDAFRESFDHRKPLMCWQHDLRDPIGHAISAQVTPRSNELVGQFSDFEAVPNSKRAFSQIEDGTITDFSFGFRQPKYEQHPKHRGVRNIRQATMMEFSPVSIGSIPGAVVTGLREEDFMTEHSAAEIAQLVEAKLITVEAGQRMLAEIPGYREHITIKTPEQQRLERLEDMFERMMSVDREPGKHVLADQQQSQAASGYDPGHAAALTNDTYGADPNRDRPTLADLQDTLTSKGYDGGSAGQLTHDGVGHVPVRPDFDDLHETTSISGNGSVSPAAVREVPNPLTADDVLAALPENYRQAIQDAKAVFALAPEGTEFFRSDTFDAESAGSIATAIEAAHSMATDWMKDVDVRSLPEPVQQAVQLWNAAGTSTDALIDVLGTRADSPHAEASPYHEPANPTGSENMASTKVSCLLCGGKGEDEDGKTCPQCGGSGLVAQTRAVPDSAPAEAIRCAFCKGVGHVEGHSCEHCGGKGWMDQDDTNAMTNRAVPDDAPTGSKSCPECKGSGKIRDGHMKCHDCNGKGWQSPSDQEDMESRASSDGWSDTPWSNFSQADYSPEQWRNACLIVTGDGSTKDQCKLPVKEPNGTYNRHGIAAAAGRLNQTDAPDEERAAAAGKLANLYGKLGQDVPPNVAEHTRREGAEEAEQLRQEALSRLNRRVKPVEVAAE